MQLFKVFRLFGRILNRLSNMSATQAHRMTITAVGRGTRIFRGVKFADPSKVALGSDCLVWSGVRVTADGRQKNLKIDDRCQINRGVLLDVSGNLSIGRDTLISEEAVLYTHHHGLDPKSFPVPVDKIIGENVWIGMRAIVLPQCASIGDGAVVGAGAVVSRNVPAGAIVAGSPARVVGWRDGFLPATASA